MLISIFHSLNGYDEGTECLLCVGHISKPWRYQAEQDRQGECVRAIGVAHHQCNKLPQIK